MEAKFVKHVTFATYGQFEESAYTFTVLFPDGSVATVPVSPFDPGFRQEDLVKATKLVNEKIYQFEMNEMKSVSALMVKKNMTSVTRGPLVTDDASYYELRFHPETGWIREWEFDGRGYHGHSTEEFRNWAELFVQLYFNRAALWPEQPKTTASVDVTMLAH